MTTINPAAQAARESARSTDGRFGAQEHSAPELGLGDSRTSDEKTRALAELDRILADHPELLAHAHEFIEPKILHTWQPDLAYVEYDDKLSDERLDEYLRGDDDSLNELDDRFREGDAYEDTIGEYLHELTGTDPLDLDDDLREELRSWVQENDHSEVIPDLVRHNGDVLVQIPAVADDDAFGIALQAASEVEGEEERYAALRQVFITAAEAAGITVDDHNRRQLESLIDENSLDFGHQAAEQWQLKVLTYTEPEDIAMTLHGEHGDASRTVRIENPSLLLIDRWNGRGYDAPLHGTFETAISVDRPARLDSQLGYGSWDRVAGVHKPAYAAHVEVSITETEEVPA